MPVCTSEVACVLLVFRGTKLARTTSKCRGPKQRLWRLVLSCHILNPCPHKNIFSIQTRSPCYPHIRTIYYASGNLIYPRKFIYQSTNRNNKHKSRTKYKEDNKSPNTTSKKIIKVAKIYFFNYM